MRFALYHTDSPLLESLWHLLLDWLNLLVGCIVGQRCYGVACSVAIKDRHSGRTWHFATRVIIGQFGRWHAQIFNDARLRRFRWNLTVSNLKDVIEADSWDLVIMKIFFQSTLFEWIWVKVWQQVWLLLLSLLFGLTGGELLVVKIILVIILAASKICLFVFQLNLIFSFITEFWKELTRKWFLQGLFRHVWRSSFLALSLIHEVHGHPSLAVLSTRSEWNLGGTLLQLRGLLLDDLKAILFELPLGLFSFSLGASSRFFEFSDENLGHHLSFLLLLCIYKVQRNNGRLLLLRLTLWRGLWLLLAILAHSLAALASVILESQLFWHVVVCYQHVLFFCLLVTFSFMLNSVVNEPVLIRRVQWNFIFVVLIGRLVLLYDRVLIWIVQTWSLTLDRMFRVFLRYWWRL